MTTRRSAGFARSPGFPDSTSAQLLPPNANELDTTTSSSCARDRFGDHVRRGRVAGSSTFTVGGSTWSRMASTHTAASHRSGGAEHVPDLDFVLLDRRSARGRRRTERRWPWVSALSLAGVPVPWPLM